MSTTIRVLVVLSLGATFLAGCSNDGSESSEARSTNSVVRLIRDTSSARFEPYSTPTDMLEAVQLVLVGHVVSVEAAVLKDEFDGQGAIVVGLEPEEVWKSSEKSASSTVTYYMFPRPKNIGVEKYRDGLESSNRVVIFADVSDVAFLEGGPPKDKRTYETAWQGMFIEADGRLINVRESGEEGWPDIYSFEELRTAIEPSITQP